MLYMTREERLIKLENMSNTRDLGGYETRQGTYTKSHQFIRGASTSDASLNDLKTLYDYGIRTIIDLRSDYEKVKEPDLFANYKGVEYVEINLFQQSKASVVPENISNFKGLGGLYIYLLEASKEPIKNVFKVLLRYPKGILFHCSAGKDRTGVIAALLLELAGCYKEDIVKDYSESYENNLSINNHLKDMMEKEHDSYLTSAPEYMIEFLDYLYENYGSSQQYLLEIGLSNLEISEIIENFTI